MTDAGPVAPVPAPEADEPFRLSVIVRGVPRAVWSVTALFASLLLAYAVLLPIYRAPDEVDHVDAVLDIEHGDGWPEPGKDLLDPPVIATLQLSGLSPVFSQYVLNVKPFKAAAAPPRSNRGSFDSLSHAPDAGQVNQITQHPPLYYILEAIPLKLVNGTSWAYDKTVLFLRLLSALIIVPLPLLAYATARRLRGPGPIALTAAILPLGVPQLLHIGASVNNDDLLTLLVGAVTVALTYVVTGDLSRRTALWVGGLTALALLTKGFAFIVPVWIGLTYTVALCRYRRRVAVGSGLIALATATLLGGWWWLRNLVLYGAIEPTGEHAAPAPSAFVPHLSALLDKLGYFLPKTFWGAFGYFEVILPDTQIEIATWTLAVAVLLALLGPGRLAIDRALVLAAPFLGLLVLVVLLSRRTYLASGAFRGMQGRYFFPGVAGLSVLVASGLAVPLRRAVGWLPLLSLLLVGGMQSFAARAILNGFWRPATAQSSYADALHTLFVWSAWPKLLVAVALSTPVAFGLLAAASLARPWSRDATA